MLELLQEEITMNNKAQELRELIRSLERKLGILEENEFSCCNISITQCHALVEIGRAKKIALNELADLLNLEDSTLSRTVNILVTKELVKRDINPEDRRYVTIALTEKGQKLFETIETHMGNYYADIFSRIPIEKQGVVLESLDILLAAVTQSNQTEKSTKAK